MLSDKHTLTQSKMCMIARMLFDKTAIVRKVSRILDKVNDIKIISIMIFVIKRLQVFKKLYSEAVKRYKICIQSNLIISQTLRNCIDLCSVG